MKLIDTSAISDTYFEKGFFFDNHKYVKYFSASNRKEIQYTEEWSTPTGKTILLTLGTIGYLLLQGNNYLNERKRISKIPEVSEINKQIEISIQDIISGNFSIDGKNCRLQIKNPSDITNQIEVAECSISQDSKITNIIYTLPNKYWHSGLNNPLQSIGVKNNEFDKTVKQKNEDYNEKVGIHIESFGQQIGKKLGCLKGYSVSYSMNDYRRTSKTSGYYHQVPVSSGKAGLTKVGCN